MEEPKQNEQDELTNKPNQSRKKKQVLGLNTYLHGDPKVVGCIIYRSLQGVW
jgi:hypothetical protein